MLSDNTSAELFFEEDTSNVGTLHLRFGVKSLLNLFNGICTLWLLCRWTMRIESVQADCRFCDIQMYA